MDRNVKVSAIVEKMNLKNLMKNQKFLQLLVEEVVVPWKVLMVVLLFLCL